MTDSLDQLKSQLQEAIAALYGNTAPAVKAQANEFLLGFQRSQEAWKVIFPFLTDEHAGQAMHMFVAQTLRSKVQYDFSQLPAGALPSLKESIAKAMLWFNGKQRAITTQLCLALTYFVLQDLGWEDAVGEIVAQFSPAAMDTLLEFLKVLPEEMMDVTRTPLTEEEFNHQVQQLLQRNVDQVLYILATLAANKTHNSAATNQLVLGCMQSWIAEIPVSRVLAEPPLCALMFEGFRDDETFDSATDCLATVIRETDVFDEANLEIVRGLYGQLLALRPVLQESADDLDRMDSLTSLFTAAAEAWHAYIAALPLEFKPLVDVVLQLTLYDEDLDVVKYSFRFWYDLKSLLTTGARQEARAVFAPTYAELIHVMMKHMRYPANSQSTDTTVLFGGDRAAEDKFKEFRYQMGDVLKDCCAVVGASKALAIPFGRLQEVMTVQAEGKPVLWQDIEASLFAMRTMAKEVSTAENKMLPQIMQYLVKLPENPKVRYAATLVLGRYTEWTAKHPEFLEDQLNYIMSGFEQKQDTDVVAAASYALKYFCKDCSGLLLQNLTQLFAFYSKVESSLDLDSLYDVTQGIAYVLREERDAEKLYTVTKMFWAPTLAKLEGLSAMQSADSAQNKQISTQIADTVEIITLYVKALAPRSYQNRANPIATLLIEQVWPLVGKLITHYGKAMPVSERCTQLVRIAMQNLSTYLLPVLDQTAQMLVYGFSEYHHGCYLWVSGALIEDYCEDATDEVKNSVWGFCLQQINNFNAFFGGLGDARQDYPNLVEDFYRMMGGILVFAPASLIQSDAVVQHVYQTAVQSLQIYHERGPVSAVLEFLIDFYSWGFDNPPISLTEEIPENLKLQIRAFAASTGAEMTATLMYGLIFSFPADSQPEANELIAKIVKLAELHSPGAKMCIAWLDTFVASLPAESVGQREKSRMLGTIDKALDTRDMRTVRASIRDFVSWYRRKNVDRGF